jgi:hypothetical protein
MIECRRRQLNDVRIPAEVLGMTGLALRCLDASQPTVEARVTAHVSTNVLVAGHAQGRLPTTIRAIVALGAVRLELGVRRRHLARHQQSLELHRGTATWDAGCQHHDDRCEDCACM